jgi:hypothetical protein
MEINKMYLLIFHFAPYGQIKGIGLQVPYFLVGEIRVIDIIHALIK